MHAEIPGLVLADPDQKLPEPTRAMPLHDNLVFSKPNAHDPVARIPEDAEVPEDDARSLVRRLQVCVDSEPFAVLEQRCCRRHE
eukprot:1496522-Rhodomonas_salina.1